jgi:broad specificity polyphosphatase/5'/3'-nucleotidase SurE
MRVLVTNDDGIGSPGLAVLAGTVGAALTAVARGFRALAVSLAPRRQRPRVSA